MISYILYILTLPFHLFYNLPRPWKAWRSSPPRLYCAGATRWPRRTAAARAARAWCTGGSSSPSCSCWTPRSWRRSRASGGSTWAPHDEELALGAIRSPILTCINIYKYYKYLLYISHYKMHSYMYICICLTPRYEGFSISC